jgi:hypothetical protein
MGRTLSFAIILGIAGLVVGYLVFGRIEGEYLNVTNIFFPSENLFGRIADRVVFREMRQNILISGGVGAVVGLVLGLAFGRGRR